MIDQIDFIEKHQKLRESADRVLGLSQSQQDFKDNTTILIYGGAVYNPLLSDMAELEQKFTVLKQRPMGKIGEFYLGSWGDFNISERKLLQSQSKQPRVVSVVCK